MFSATDPSRFATGFTFDRAAHTFSPFKTIFDIQPYIASTCSKKQSKNAIYFNYFFNHLAPYLRLMEGNYLLPKRREKNPGD
jgi:hypothetical protein